MSQMTVTAVGNMTRAGALGARWWNDSCDPGELADAVAHGAVGATSNPVIVGNVVKGDPDRWLPEVDALIAANPTDTEVEVAWKLIAQMGRIATEILRPVHERTSGAAGYLCLQVNPTFHPNAARMIEHGLSLASVADNVAIKIPGTAVGLQAVEELTRQGVAVNVTVSFTVPQAVAAAEAIERGLRGARDPESIHPYVTIMQGRMDDHLKRIRDADGIEIDPEALEWAGIAVFKRAARIFEEAGFRATLLGAAFRNIMQWSANIGPNVLLTIPYPNWNEYDAAEVDVRPSLHDPVEARYLDALQTRFEDFRRAYEPDGMTPDEFAGFGPSIHTLNQFIDGYYELLAIVRGRMLV